MDGDKTFRVFIGYAGDAEREMNIVKGLESEVQKYLQHEANAFSSSKIFENVDFWKWRGMTSTTAGGQKEKIDPKIKDCHLAIFVFRKKIGNTTRGEVELAKEDRSRHILCFFPDDSLLDKDIKNDEYYQNMGELVTFKRSLTEDWGETDSKSITPVNTYIDDDLLKRTALQTINAVIKEIYEKAKTGQFEVVVNSSESIQPLAVSQLELKHFMTGKRLNNPSSQFYYERDKDKDIFGHLSGGTNVLVAGNSLAGKTRAVFEAVRKLTDKKILIVKTKHDFSQLEYDGETIVFFDDIDEFLAKKEKDELKNFLEELIEKNIQIVATCRNGNEYRDFSNAFKQRFIDDNFHAVEFSRLDGSDKTKFESYAKQQIPGIRLDEKSFDKNIGSFFMDLSIMKERYRNLDSLCVGYGKQIDKKTLSTILKALHTFYYAENMAGKNLYDKDKIFDFCERKLTGTSNPNSSSSGDFADKLKSAGLTPSGRAITRPDFEDGLEILKDDRQHLNFIDDFGETIYIEEVYLVKIIGEQIKPEEIIYELKKLYPGDDEISKCGFFANVYSFSKLIHQEEEIKKAFNILEKMNKMGIKPNEVTYSSIIVKTANLAEANTVLDRMVKEGLKPDAHTLSSVIKKIPQTDNESLKTILKNFQQRRVKADIFVIKQVTTKFNIAIDRNLNFL